MKVLHSFFSGRSLLASVVLLILVLVSACGGRKGEYRIKGKVKHLREGEFYIYSDNGFDTIRIKDFKFDFTGKATEAEIKTLLFPNFQQLPLICKSGLVLSVEADAKNFNQTAVSGDDENKMLSRFMQQNGGLPMARLQREAASFIRQHPESRAAEALWRTAFVEGKETPTHKAVELLQLMQKYQPHNSALAKTGMLLEAVVQTTKGNPLPSFTACTRKGDTLNAKKLGGKWTLFTFWANWNYDSYNLVRQVRGMKLRFPGRLNTVNISFETNRLQWERTLQRDSIPEPNICDLKGLQSPLVRTFGIRYLPCNLLVNANGIIEGRDMSMADVEKRLNAALKKQ